MSKLYRARVTLGQMNRLVVIKVVHPATVQESRYKDLFFQEIGITQALEHPNIIKILEYGETESSPFVVMEYLNGKNLRQIVGPTPTATQKSLPLDLTLWVAVETLKALQYAHSFTDRITGKKQSVIHGDLSPHNLMLTYDGALKLIDFGIARVVTDDSATVTDTIRGKVSYLAPEQLEGKRASTASDLFSLGVVLCELLTGKRLFNGATDFVTVEMIKNADTFVQTFCAQHPMPSPEIKAVITRLLRTDSKLRYQNADDVQGDIEKIKKEFAPDFDSKAVARFMVERFANDLELEKKRISQLAEQKPAQALEKKVHHLEARSLSDDNPLPELDHSQDESEAPPTPKDLPKVELEIIPPVTIQAVELSDTSEQTPNLASPVAGPKRLIRRGVLITLLVAGGALAFYGWSDYSNSQLLNVDIEIDPPDLKQTLFIVDGEEVALDPSHPVMTLKIGQLYRLEVSKPGYNHYQRMIRMERPTHRYAKENTISIVLIPKTQESH